MPNYQEGKIYRLYIEDTQYIGSTTLPYLSTRMAIHKSGYKTWLKTGANYVTSYKLFECGVPQIELIEKYPCSSIIELREREGMWISKMECVNKRKEGQTYEEWYYENASKFKDYERDNPNSKDNIKAYRAEKNTHPLNLIYVKKWRSLNREKYLKWHREKSLKRYNYKQIIKELYRIDPTLFQ